MRFNRRCFLRTTTAATAVCLAGPGLFAGEGPPVSDSTYVRANTDWLARCRFGIGIHWTAQTVPRNGEPKPFQKAVADFDLQGFMAAVEHAGADYVLFTAAHALQMLPAPNPVLDKILPGRTCERDLIWELADALAAKQKHLLVYHNHSCNAKQDAAWEQAVGYHAPHKEPFATNLLEIVTWMGDRYRDKLKAWWFDSPYSLDARGPHNSVTTDMTGFQFPWERLKSEPGDIHEPDQHRNPGPPGGRRPSDGCLPPSSSAGFVQQRRGSSGLSCRPPTAAASPRRHPAGRSFRAGLLNSSRWRHARNASAGCTPSAAKPRAACRLPVGCQEPRFLTAGSPVRV